MGPGSRYVPEGGPFSCRDRAVMLHLGVHPFNCDWPGSTSRPSPPLCPTAAGGLAAKHRGPAACRGRSSHSSAPGLLTRTFLRQPVRDVHERLTVWMREAGLNVRTDAIGNLIGRLPGGRDDGRMSVVGSHIDSVPDAGKYDGVLGVLLGVAAAKALAGHEFPRTLDVIAFSEEEGVR